MRRACSLVTLTLTLIAYSNKEGMLHGNPGLRLAGGGGHDNDGEPGLRLAGGGHDNDGEPGLRLAVEPVVGARAM